MRAAVPDALLQAAESSPSATFRVIVQARDGHDSGDVAADVSNSVADNPGRAKGLRRRFVSIAGVSAQLTGRQILFLSALPGILAITADAPLQPAGGPIYTTPPSVAGLAQQGETLTSLEGIWMGTGTVSLLEQWQRCDATGAACTDLPGATGTSYVAAAADVGSTLRVAVTASDGGGTTTAASIATAVVAAAPVAPTVLAPSSTTQPTVTGTAQDGATLTATTGNWTGASTYAYQWQRCSTADRTAALLATNPLGLWRFGDSGAVAADATGHGLSGTYVGTATAGGTGADGGPGALQLDGTSGAVDVAGLASDVFTRGFTLQAWVKVAAPQANVGVVGKWSYAQGGGVMLWIDESGRYAVVATGDARNYLTTDVAPTPGQWEHMTATWDRSTLQLFRNGVLVGSRPFVRDPGWPTTDLRIGDYEGAHHLNGLVDDVAVYDRALSPVEISNDAAGCRDIGSATGPTLTVDGSLIGASVRAVVTATGTGGTTSAASSATAAVTAAPPAAVAPPAVTGVPATGRRLTATNGTWTGTQPLTFAYQWQRCDSTGACNDLIDADGASYTSRPADAGNFLRVVVTATGPGGAGTVATQPLADSAYSNAQMWPYAAGLDRVWPATVAENPQAPAIAIVDSGIDASRLDFGNRVVKEVTLTSLTPNSPGDGRGHGTFVASVAAGSGPSFAGAAPNAHIVSLDVMNDSGMALTSDVIAAADWIYQNKGAYNIRVANLSLQEASPSSIRYDPLNKAVEKLWLSGVVVVAAAGNFAAGGAESGVPFSPADDPFVITVGAADIAGTVSTQDDTAAPWSAWGHTADGFSKPEIGAPGRYIVGAVPPNSTLATEYPSQVIDGAYLQLSGTSFSAAAVSGAVADVLELHPDWTPDQVKGALMASASATSATPRSLGVGEISAPAAAAVTNPPNPNAPVDHFLIPDPAGGSVPVFDTESWGLAAQNNPAWATESWGLESWGLESWGLNYWETPPTPGGTGTGTDSTPTTAADNAANDALPDGGYWISHRG